MPKRWLGFCFEFFFSLLALTASTAHASPLTLHLPDGEHHTPLVGVFILPGETISLDATGNHPRQRLNFAANAGTPECLSPHRWNWRAPFTNGVYSLTVTEIPSGDKTQVNVFVLVPFAELRNGKLRGYRIGNYPSPKNGRYALPRGFIEVTRETEQARVSPHFQLKQFVCKQSGGYPKYIALSARLITKLEMLLEKVNEKGFHTATFHVMSGYRTPAYNHALGNVLYSRHMFGDAADIYIEDPHTGQMADLNGDGKVDARDAALLYSMVNELSQSHPDLFPVGGAGTYGSTQAHGPFLHIDARGFSARWGTIATAAHRAAG